MLLRSRDNKQSGVTTVVVKDKDTIAMGGLMRDQSIESVSKVPLLVIFQSLDGYSKIKRKQ